MTTAIEVTKREMYKHLEQIKETAKNGFTPNYSIRQFEPALEAHLEALRQDRATLVTERDTLRNRVQVLEMANATSGEVIRSLKREAEQARKALMVARLTEFAAQVSSEQENVASDALDTKTATILGALVDAQRIMTDYLVPDGIRAKVAMDKIIPVLDNETLFMAMRAYERPNCMHSFHPAFPSGELCTFCGVGK